MAQKLLARLADAVRAVLRMLQEAVESRDDARGDVVDPGSSVGNFLRKNRNSKMEGAHPGASLEGTTYQIFILAFWYGSAG